MNININDIINQKKKSLSASQYVLLNEYPNNNKTPLKDYSNLTIIPGKEPNGSNYLDASNIKMIKTNVVTDNSFTLFDASNDDFQGIKPTFDFKHELKEGDILFLKDGDPGRCIMLSEDMKDCYVCGGIIILRISDIQKRNYLFGFLKSKYFKEQKELIIPPGSTFGHGGEELVEDCDIYLPNYDTEYNKKVYEYVEWLIDSIKRKEVEINNKYNKTIQFIESELKNNSKTDNSFNHFHPSIKELMITSRLDASTYTEDINRKEFLVKNYNNGYYIFKITGKIGSYNLVLTNISDINDNIEFNLKRGKDLGFKYIGKSIETSKNENNYYRLIKGSYLSKFGTIEEEKYLGCKANIFTLNKNELILSVTGALGKSHIFINEPVNSVLNINSVILSSKSNDLIDTIYLKQCLDYLKYKDLLKDHSVGGNGGSLAPYYMNGIVVPKLSKEKMLEMSLFYHNSITYDISSLNFNEIYNYDKIFTEKAGIYELDITRKMLINELSQAYNCIMHKKPVNFLYKH